MEELDLSSILSPEEIEGLFAEENDNVQVSPPEQKGEKEKTKEETTEEVPDGENPFESPESVGSGKEDKQGKEDTSPEGSGTSPKTPISTLPLPVP